jgi:DNA-binding MarR family transcriptional regulator
MLSDLKQSLEPLQLRPVTFSVLAVVDLNPGLSQVGVGSVLDIQRANLGGIIFDLEARGWIVRTDSPVDRRLYVLNLTAEGARVLKRAWSVVREHEERLLARLNADSRRKLLSMLRELMPVGTEISATGRSPPSRRRTSRPARSSAGS